MNHRPRQLALDLVQPLRPSLDNFVVGGNAEAVAALRAMAAGGGEKFVLLWGAEGSGRSHLLRAVAASAASCWIDPETREPAFDPALRIYVADDVDRYDAGLQQRLFVLQNDVRAARDAVLLASASAPPGRLALREDVRTRLAWGLVYQLHALTDAEKEQALRTHGASRGIELSSEVLGYLMTHMPRDLSTQIAILDALDAYALAAKRAITVPLIREWAQAPA
ncbi:MAG TPA: DnaA regulatory inactivator Hda [Burkholderiaceae bacterium]|nr:DnaA regulatory inactivator Hda [Burkholderiaceae bacterium]